MTAKHKFTAAFTLVEMMIAMAVVAIAALGALSYQYYAATHIQIARTQITATRTAQLLLEDWKSTGGSTSYDPTALGLGFSTPEREAEADFFVNVDNLPMYITLSYNDIDYDNVAGITLRKIAVTVKWRKDRKQGPTEADDPSLVLTTYVRVDASGG